jgi:hypothetical protein
MDITKGKQELNSLCKDKDWFHEVGTDQYGRLIVYVKWQSEAILRFVPDTAGGIQVLVHSAGSKTAKSEDFVQHPLASVQRLPVDNARMPLAGPPPSTNLGFGKPIAEPEFDQLMDLPLIGTEDEEQSLRHLQDELDRLEKICGTNTLSDIFFEIKDGKNAITNMSSRFPDVRKSMDKLYDTYGFDVLYEELEL